MYKFEMRRIDFDIYEIWTDNVDFTDCLMVGWEMDGNGWLTHGTRSEMMYIWNYYDMYCKEMGI